MTWDELRVMMTCSRQSGKSTVAACLAVRKTLLEPGSLTLLLSPSLRQSGELFRKARTVLSNLGPLVPVTRETQLTLELANGSRLVSLPGTEQTVRGFSAVGLLIIDEAGDVPDGLYEAVRPMLAVSQGSMVVLGTPRGKRGFFYREWMSQGDDWQRICIPATMCPRIPADFLERERLSLGDRVYRAEYCCEWSALSGAVFDDADVEAAFVDVPDFTPLFQGRSVFS